MNRIKAQRIKLAKEHQLNRKYVDKLRKVVRRVKQEEAYANSLTFEDIHPHSMDREPKLVKGMQMNEHDDDQHFEDFGIIVIAVCISVVIALAVIATIVTAF